MRVDARSWMVGLAHDAAHFFKFLLILILFAICTTLWNFVLAAAIDDTGSAILVSSVCVQPLPGVARHPPD